MRRAPRAALAALLATSGGLALGAAEAPKVTATLEPAPVGRDEPATLTIAVESPGFGGAEVEPDFTLENFELVGGPFRSTTQSWVNGVSSSTVQLVWRLRPRGIGRAAVRALRVEVDGRLVELPDQTVEVVAEPPPRAGPRRPRPDPFGSLFENDPLAPFFRDDPFDRSGRRRGRPPAADPKVRVAAEVEPATAWVGQQVAWRLQLETQTDVVRVEPKRLPEFRGFWVRDTTPDETPPPRWIEEGGEKFARVPVLSRALFPLEAGPQELPPVEVEVYAQVVDAGFLRPIAQTRRLLRATRPARLVVRPLPPAPPGFHGIVGALALEAEVDRARIEAGQAASFTLSAESTGNLDAVEPPQPQFPEGLRAFPPTRESRELTIRDRLETTVRWHWVLVADRPGRYPLAAVEMVHFDPASAAYRVARAAPLELLVAEPSRSASAVPAAPAATAAATPPGRSGLTALAGPVGAGALALGSVAAGALVWRRRRRLGRPAQALRAALAAAEREPSARAAAAALEEAWRRYLAERWAIARSLPAAQWGARLAARGAPESAAREIAALFDELHFLAYAPELADVEAHRAEVVAHARRLLRRLG